MFSRKSKHCVLLFCTVFLDINVVVNLKIKISYPPITNTRDKLYFFLVYALLYCYMDVWNWAMSYIRRYDNNKIHSVIIFSTFNFSILPRCTAVTIKWFSLGWPIWSGPTNRPCHGKMGLGGLRPLLRNLEGHQPPTLQVVPPWSTLTCYSTYTVNKNVSRQ